MLTNAIATIHYSPLTIHPDVEDIHSQVELLLTQKLGDAGKKIHSARSRNDQVLVDVKLFLRHELEGLVKNIPDFDFTLGLLFIDRIWLSATARTGGEKFNGAGTKKKDFNLEGIPPAK